MSEIFGTVCYTLADALVWLVLGMMAGYAIFAPERRCDK